MPAMRGRQVFNSGGRGIRSMSDVSYQLQLTSREQHANILHVQHWLHRQQRWDVLRLPVRHLQGRIRRRSVHKLPSERRCARGQYLFHSLRVQGGIHRQ